MNVEIATEAAQFFFWEHINGIFVAVKRLKAMRIQDLENCGTDSNVIG